MCGMSNNNNNKYGSTLITLQEWHTHNLMLKHKERRWWYMRMEICGQGDMRIMRIFLDATEFICGGIEPTFEEFTDLRSIQPQRPSTCIDRFTYIWLATTDSNTTNSWKTIFYKQLEALNSELPLKFISQSGKFTKNILPS